MVNNEKQVTEVGIIPKDWDEPLPLSQCSSKILDGEHFSPKFTNSGIPYLSSQHIKSKISFDNCKYVSDKTYSKIIKRIHPEYDDILITVKGTIGFCKRIDIQEKFCMDRNVGLIKPIKKIVNSIFLENLMRSHIVQKQILSLLDSNVIPSLYLNNLRKIKIPVPSIPEQEKIAQVLFDIEEIIRRLDYLIEKKKNIKQGMVQELLIGKRRLNGFTEKWKTVILRNYVNFSTGSSKSYFEESNGKYIIMDMGSVSRTGKNISKKYTNLKDDLLQYGDLVMPKDDIGGGNIIGKTAFIDENHKYVLGDHVYRLRMKDSSIDSKFLSYLINSFKINREIRKKVVGSAQLGINRKSLEELSISIPKNITEQRLIAEILSDMDYEIKEIDNQREKYAMIKQGLTQKLLTGEIRLK